MTTQLDFEAAKELEGQILAGISSDVSSKEAERERFAKATEEFLARGGKITKVESYVAQQPKSISEKASQSRKNQYDWGHRNKDSIGRPKGAAHEHSKRTFRARKERGL